METILQIVQEIAKNSPFAGSIAFLGWVALQYLKYIRENGLSIRVKLDESTIKDFADEIAKALKPLPQVLPAFTGPGTPSK